MTIAYSIGRSLYLNITNRCPNDCVFCIRQNGDGIGDTQLWLKTEPDVDQILQSVEDPTGYAEIVFCGYGEPIMRLDVVVSVAKALRPFGIPIRLDTNGLADLIHGRDVWPDLAGLLDTVSISLNAHNAAEYDKLCHSKWGENAFQAMLNFTSRAKDYVPKVILTVVDYPGVNLKACRNIADGIGVSFRVRHYEAPPSACRRAAAQN